MIDRTTAPQAQAIALPHIPETESVDLPNGVSVTVLNQGEQPVVFLEMVFPVGRTNEPKPGISYFVGKMLTEGTTKRNSEEIASAFDFYGSHLEITPTLDSIHVKLFTLNKFFPTLITLLIDLLEDSIIPEKEFKTLKQIRIQQVRQQLARNNAFSSLKFRELLFGPEHPYGRINSEAAVEEITLEEVRDYFGTAFSYRPRLFLSGFISDDIKQVISDSFGKLQFVAPETESSFEYQTAQSERIDRKANQASIRYGNFTINRRHSDIHKLRVANYLLGGFFGSRLMKNIREEKGLTYGIHSSFMHLNDDSFWQISTEVLRDSADLAMDEITREIHRLQHEPPSREELDTVISYLKGKLLTSFDTPFNTIGSIKNVILNGMGMEYFHDYQHTLATITPEEISETTTRYFIPEKALRLIVE